MVNARARNTDPSQSHDAASSVDVQKSERIILTMLHTPRCKNKWLNSWHISEATGIQYASVTPRMKSLRNNNLVDAVKAPATNPFTGQQLNKIFHYRVKR